MNRPSLNRRVVAAFVDWDVLLANAWRCDQPTVVSGLIARLLRIRLAGRRLRLRRRAVRWFGALTANCPTGGAPAKQPDAKDDQQHQHAHLEWSAQQLEWEAEPSAQSKAAIPWPSWPTSRVSTSGRRTILRFAARPSCSPLCIRTRSKSTTLWPGALLRVRARRDPTALRPDALRSGALLRIGLLPVRAAQPRRDLRAESASTERDQQRQRSQADRDPSQPTSVAVHV
jgi:hypothetical protein